MRPKKDRCVKFNPEVKYFKPRGIPLTELEEVNITVCGLEALRLADFLNMSHEEAGKSMNVSRATFGRILEQTRKAVAEGLLFGKAIKIDGGTCVQEERMIKALIFCDDKKPFSELAEEFEKNNVDITWAESEDLALSMISEKRFDLLITYESFKDIFGKDISGKDISGIALVRKIVLIDSMLNCVLASSLSPKDFHEATEGLGILMQLPVNPKKADAEKLLTHLNIILSKYKA